MPINEVVEKVTVGVGVALATVRRQVPNLPFGIAFDRTDQSVHLAFKHDDAPSEMATAVEQLPQDLAYHKSLGWDRDRGIWFDL